MSLRGVVRGRTIELEEDPLLPDGTAVEVELRTLRPDPLWGLLAEQPDLVQTLHQVVSERALQQWRASDETSPT